jgi:hypothetical protein
MICIGIPFSGPPFSSSREANGMTSLSGKSNSNQMIGLSFFTPNSKILRGISPLSG